jgi:predicted hotdog family 3-hydroxylacyl-ACP dehydratase
MKPIVDKDQIEQYIPQRAPMIMIDKLVRIEEDKVTTSFVIDSHNILVKDNLFSSMGLIENMAQTAAMASGHYFISRGESVKKGFIGSVKNFVASKWPSVGEEIYTTIREVQEVMNIKIIEAEVFLDENCIASCELKIFILEDDV